jgi:nucleoside-diphosphate-sugar epimerase
VVVASPGIALGAGDVNRISTFMVEQYLRGALRVTMPGGLNYVDARDVVASLTAVEETRGARQRYIIGTADGKPLAPRLLQLVADVSACAAGPSTCPRGRSSPPCACSAAHPCPCP